MLETELERALPAYEPRPAQLAMAEQVERALSQGRALVVEAGTGTGKTLAYLLPAARSGLKVVISTATKTLQEQLAHKDVPLAMALGAKARFAFLKGRQNYLCLLRKEHFDRQLRRAALQLPRCRAGPRRLASAGDAATRARSGRPALARGILVLRGSGAVSTACGKIRARLRPVDTSTGLIGSR